MYLTENDVRGIATYARIGLSDGEVAAMTVDLNNIIESLRPITEYDLEGVEPTFHPIAGLANVMREDAVRPGLAHQDAMAIAPHVESGAYRIPPILGDNGGDR
ncbi:MAG: Asp-tRNA(Asn)/Glu-tRNA(Gln) amidotransferase subunit GatC [Coriobacteriales bacterium]|jgi:aspartyl-tRNA(Asn)/glutamyl-tRNA(Gln) amidotransferase subunit C|nr:Asp-tRNA(Asn)/Glu-tRNA(Gln) amidotransferase subunit GatC [Coriobacteriales bacterium]